MRGFSKFVWIAKIILWPSKKIYKLIECVNLLTSKGSVTLTLSDMKVTRRHHNAGSSVEDLLYSVHTVGLYIMISVPSRGMTLIWDKHTRITVELHPQWRVSQHKGFGLRSARKICVILITGFENVGLRRSKMWYLLSLVCYVGLTLLPITKASGKELEEDNQTSS